MFIKYNLVWLFLFTSVLFFSCKNDEAKYAQIEQAIEIGEQHPREALSILDSISNIGQLDERGFMLYQIAYVVAKRNLNEAISEEQTEQISKAAAFFKEEQNFKYAWLANFYASRAYYSQGDVEQQLTHNLKAYDCAVALNDSLKMGKTLYNIGVMYYDQHVYDSTQVYLQKAIPLFEKYPEIEVQAYRLLALAYYQIDNLEATLRYLDKGSPFLKEGDNAKFVHLYNTLYAAICDAKGQTAKATEYLRRNMADDKIPQIEIVRTALNLTEIYTSSHEMDSAAYYQQLVEPLLVDIDIKDDELLLFGYETLLNYYTEVGNKVKAKEYFDLLKERLNIIEKKNEAETLFYVDKKNKKIQQLEISQKEYKKALYFLSIITLLFVGILVFVFIRIKQRREKTINTQRDTIAKLNDEKKKIASKKNIL